MPKAVRGGHLLLRVFTLCMFGAQAMSLYAEQVQSKNLQNRAYPLANQSPEIHLLSQSESAIFYTVSSQVTSTAFEIFIMVSMQASTVCQFTGASERLTQLHTQTDTDIQTDTNTQTGTHTHFVVCPGVRRDQHVAVVSEPLVPAIPSARHTRRCDE